MEKNVDTKLEKCPKNPDHAKDAAVIAKEVDDAHQLYEETFQKMRKIADQKGINWDAVLIVVALHLSDMAKEQGMMLKVLDAFISGAHDFKKDFPEGDAMRKILDFFMSKVVITAESCPHCSDDTRKILVGLGTSIELNLLDAIRVFMKYMFDIDDEEMANSKVWVQGDSE